MWWKLIALVVVTIAVIVSVIPIRSRATKYDLPPAADMQATPRLGQPIKEMIANAYVTPTATILVLIIVTAAVFIAWRIVRVA